VTTPASTTLPILHFCRRSFSSRSNCLPKLLPSPAPLRSNSPSQPRPTRTKIPTSSPYRLSRHRPRGTPPTGPPSATAPLMPCPSVPLRRPALPGQRRAIPHPHHRGVPNRSPRPSFQPCRTSCHQRQCSPPSHVRHHSPEHVPVGRAHRPRPQARRLHLRRHLRRLSQVPRREGLRNHRGFLHRQWHQRRARGLLPGNDEDEFHCSRLQTPVRASNWSNKNNAKGAPIPLRPHHYLPNQMYLFFSTQRKKETYLPAAANSAQRSDSGGRWAPRLVLSLAQPRLWVFSLTPMIP